MGSPKVKKKRKERKKEKVFSPRKDISSLVSQSFSQLVSCFLVTVCFSQVADVAKKLSVSVLHGGEVSTSLARTAPTSGAAAEVPTDA